MQRHHSSTNHCHHIACELTLSAVILPHSSLVASPGLPLDFQLFQTLGTGHWAVSILRPIVFTTRIKKDTLFNYFDLEHFILVLLSEVLVSMLR